MLTIAGDVKGPVAFGGVGIGRIDPQAPLTAAYLNTHLYLRGACPE